MEKIQKLLEKAGCKPELAQQICESLEKYKTTMREQLEAEYTAKVEEAKKVCIEETESHKRELARRLSIFCEAKGAAIEAQLAKQSALNESEAFTKLQSIRELLDGFVQNGEQNGNFKAALDKATQKVKLACEERDRALAKANRQTAIAERALKLNRRLTAENTQLRGGRQTVAEGTNKPRRQGRIDTQRGPSQRPTSTRATLLENQDRRPPARPTSPHVSGTGQGKGFGVQDIAAAISEDLI